MKKRDNPTPKSTGKRPPRAVRDDVRVVVELDIFLDQSPRIVEETTRATEYHEALVTKLREVWEACRLQRLQWPPERPPPTGRLTVDIHLTKRPKHVSSEESELLLEEMATCARSVFLGETVEPLPINIRFARGEVKLRPSPTNDEESLVPKPKITDTKTLVDNEPPRREDNLQSPEDTIKALVDELIPTLSPQPEEKAAAIIAFHRALNQTYWQHLQGVVQPLIKALLEDIPPDYEGKRRRATLVNALLTTLEVGILVHDQQGRPHLCSAHPGRGRVSDEQGYLRLIERTASGPSRKSFSIPPLDQLQIVETPQLGQGGQDNSAHGTGTSRKI
jgi:hypothetical protein